MTPGATAAHEQNPIPQVLSGSADDILEFVLSTPIHPKTVRSLERPSSSYNQNIDAVWDGHEPKGLLAAIIDNPYFVEIGNPDVFSSIEGYRAAVHTEIQNRHLQRQYFNALDKLIAEVQDTDDLIKLVDVFGFLDLHSKTEVFGPGKFGRRIIEQSVAMVEDPIAGDASPVAAASLALPVVSRLLDQQHALQSDREPRQINAKISADFLTNGNRGTAEYSAALRLREMLAEKGYEGFGQTTASRRHDHRISDRYITTSTLREITNKSGEVFLPDGAEAMDEVQKNIITTLEVLSFRGDPVAASILAAFKKIYAENNNRFSGQRGKPLNAALEIANAISIELNKQENLTGNQSLDPLDTHDLSQMPFAFQRILFAIDPNLLKEALEGPVKGGSPLRHRMARVEALSQQWDDSRRIMEPSVGDTVLRLKAKGVPNDKIVEIVDAQSGGKPDVRATNNVRSIVHDPDTKETHVEFNRNRPGYGVLS